MYVVILIYYPQMPRNAASFALIYSYFFFRSPENAFLCVSKCYTAFNAYYTLQSLLQSLYLFYIYCNSKQCDLQFISSPKDTRSVLGIPYFVSFPPTSISVLYLSSFISCFNQASDHRPRRMRDNEIRPVHVYTFWFTLSLPCLSRSDPYFFLSLLRVFAFHVSSRSSRALSSPLYTPSFCCSIDADIHC